VRNSHQVTLARALQQAVPAAGALAAAAGAAGVCDEGVDGAAELADADAPALKAAGTKNLELGQFHNLTA